MSINQELFVLFLQKEQTSFPLFSGSARTQWTLRTVRVAESSFHPFRDRNRRTGREEIGNKRLKKGEESDQGVTEVFSFDDHIDHAML